MPDRPDDPRARQPAQPNSVTPSRYLSAPSELTSKGLRHTTWLEEVERLVLDQSHEHSPEELVRGHQHLMLLAKITVGQH